MMLRFRLVHGFAVLAAIVVWQTSTSGQVQAQPAGTATREALPPPNVPSSARELDGHLFIPTELLVQPFTDTRFRSTTGFGVVRANAPTLDLLGRDESSTRNFRQAGYAQSFELQVRVLPWLALRANAGATIYSGLNALAILRLGSVVQYGGGGGITIAQTFGHVRVAAVGDIQYTPTSSIDVLGAILSSIEQAEVDTGPLFTTEHVKPLRVGLSSAMALSKAVGLAVEGRYQHTFGGAAAFTLQDAILASAAVDFDLKAITPVPIGMLLAYQAQVPLGDEDRKAIWQSANAGLFYTGRRDLVLGLEASGKRNPQHRQVLSEGLVGSLVTRYYW